MSLTKRQREILDLLVNEGLQTKQVAGRLGLAPASVANCLAYIRKLHGLKNNAQLGVLAEREGLATIQFKPVATNVETS